MIGWIKIHRKIMDKAFYCKDSEKVHLWIHILLKANHSEREELFNNKPVKCKAGQFTTGRKQLSLETGISESKIQRLLTYFEKTEQQIKQQTCSVNRLITVLNWGEYQISEQGNEQQLNSGRTSSEQQLNTLKELKELKELNKDFDPKKPFIIINSIKNEHINDLWNYLRNKDAMFESIAMQKKWTESFVKQFVEEKTGQEFSDISHIKNSLNIFNGAVKPNVSPMAKMKYIN